MEYSFLLYEWVKIIFIGKKNKVRGKTVSKAFSVSALNLPEQAVSVKKPSVRSLARPPSLCEDRRALSAGLPRFSSALWLAPSSPFASQSPLLFRLSLATALLNQTMGLDAEKSFLLYTWRIPCLETPRKGNNSGQYSPIWSIHLACDHCNAPDSPLWSVALCSGVFRSEKNRLSFLLMEIYVIGDESFDPFLIAIPPPHRKISKAGPVDSYAQGGQQQQTFVNLFLRKIMGCHVVVFYCALLSICFIVNSGDRASALVTFTFLTHMWQAVEHSWGMKAGISFIYLTTVVSRSLRAGPSLITHSAQHQGCGYTKGRWKFLCWKNICRCVIPLYQARMGAGIKCFIPSSRSGFVCYFLLITHTIYETN